MSIVLFNIGLSFLSRDRHKTALRVLSLLEGRTVTDDDISREESGRPYFKQVTGNREQVTGETIDFNISHSGDMVAVSYVKGFNNEMKLRTGCDIQIVKERTNTLRIAEQLFTPAENEYILTQKEKNNEEAFFKIWTLKECYIKLHGLSVFDLIPKGGIVSVPEFVKEDGSLNLTIDGVSFFLYKLSGNNGQKYVLAAAVKGEAIREICSPDLQWFSEPLLSCEPEG